jgi:hypothetical protein
LGVSISECLWNISTIENFTAIDAGVWLPDSSGWRQITNLKTKANFDGTPFGFGLTPTAASGGFSLHWI